MGFSVLKIHGQLSNTQNQCGHEQAHKDYSQMESAHNLIS